MYLRHFKLLNPACQRNKVLCLLIVIYCFKHSTEDVLFDGCDHTYNLKPGYFYLDSPYYPNSYPSGTSCRYKFVAPLDYIITINCTINLDQANNGCSTEFFYLATDGDILLRDSEQLCGSGTFIRQSLFRSAVLAYISYGSYGKFSCQLYAQPQPCDCGWSFNTEVAPRQQTAINEFPSMVALKDKRTKHPLFCGGTIISHYHILTAAHCTRAQKNPTYLEVQVGRHNLTSKYDTRNSAVYSISYVIEHPSYTNDPINNDIAILVTSTPIEWSRTVGPICLPPPSSASNTFDFEYVDVIGWGTTSFAGPISPILQKIKLVITDYDACFQAYQDITPIYSTHICTYDDTGRRRDSCQFDSGGPVVLRKHRQFLLGIISFGNNCGLGHAFGVNTRVTSYLQWIYENTGYTTCFVNL